jgi:phage terminase large subunit
MIAADKIKEWRNNPIVMVRDLFKVEPDLWQADVLKAFGSRDPEKMRIAMSACAGPGKNIVSGYIPTPYGLRDSQNLKVGDKVFAEDGSVTSIVGVINWGIRDHYKITFCDGTHAICGDKHIWKVRASNNYKRFKDWSLVEAEVLFALKLGATRRRKENGKEREYYSRFFKIPAQGAAQYEEKELDVDPYLLGLWLGDGHRLAGNYSGQRYIPRQYLEASVEQRTELLRGLLDTDGRIKSNGMIEFHSTSKKMIKDVLELARSLGCYAHDQREVDSRKDNDCYCVNIRSPFNPFKIPRKANRWRKPPDFRLQRSIQSVEKVESQRCVCIEVEHPSGCYLANDFIVTHNSCVMAWCGWNFLLCYATRGNHPKGAAVSVTQDNLKDNLWPEFSKWQGRCDLLSKLFVWTKSRIFARESPATWFLSARSWSKSADEEEQGRTLSGLHSDYILYLIDESGDIPPPILRSAEQGLTSCKWGKILQAGNPTSHDGMLYLATTKLRDKWHIINITGDPDDPKRSPRISIEWAREQIENYGRDNPWVMSYILGKFPPSAINTLLSPDEVEAAMDRHIKLSDYTWSQKRLGIDAARFGDDDWVIFPRQGLAAFKPVVMKNPRSQEVASRVIFAKRQWGSELEFFDGTGGYASGAVDYMVQSGFTPIEIDFSSAAMDNRYYLRRSEMWFRMAEWIKRGGALPRDNALIKELTTPTYTYHRGKFYLEPKEQFKKRLKFSPNRADALALTFAYPDQASETAEEQAMSDLVGEGANKAQTEFDPYKE